MIITPAKFDEVTQNYIKVQYVENCLSPRKAKNNLVNFVIMKMKIKPSRGTVTISRFNKFGTDWNKFS